MALTHVFEPIMIGNVEIPNRIVRTAHDAGHSITDISDDAIAYHAARAKGGCGLSILEASSVHPSSKIHVDLYRDEIVPGLQKLMAAVRPHGMKVFQQLWHGGNLYPAADGGPPWAVSDVPGFWGMVGRVMSTSEVQELRQAFVDAALKCKAGGIDGVELHLCHGYIFHQFLSPFYNNRTDQYGGSPENRARFLFETVRAVREAVGPDFVVGVRVGASEQSGGIDEDMNKAIITQLESEKLIDFVDISIGDYYRFDTMLSAMHAPSGYELPSTADIGSVSTVPRIVTGRFRTLEEAEQVLRGGQADLVSMVRAQIADPDLVRKTRDIGPEAVRPCIGCNQGCLGGLFRVGRMGCAVNPAAGAELSLSEDLIVATEKPRKILIVGGGPAGMEAARVAATKGHNVILCEAQPSLGGAINIAKSAPFLAGIGDITYWLEQEVYRLGVNVRLGTYMEIDDIVAENADEVLIATGSMPRVDGFQIANPARKVAGVNFPHVMSSTDLLTATDKPKGKAALVLDTVGHYESLSVVEYLLNQGMAVTYVTNDVSMTPYVHSTWRDLPALERFYALGEFELKLRHELVEIRTGDCIIRPLQAGANQTQTVPADTVVLVTQNTPLRGLFDELRERGLPSRLIGDALSPRDMQVAIAEGHNAARAFA
jgi:2,4-dienoyl-CoA reductase-like NADH-dependent reductase (Old Yellow Enzyme family)/thioredoxin reductase